MAWTGHGRRLGAFPSTLASSATSRSFVGTCDRRIHHSHTIIQSISRAKQSTFDHPKPSATTMRLLRSLRLSAGAYSLTNYSSASTTVTLLLVACVLHNGNVDGFRMKNPLYGSGVQSLKSNQHCIYPARTTTTTTTTTPQRIFVPSLKNQVRFTSSTAFMGSDGNTKTGDSTAPLESENVDNPLRTVDDDNEKQGFASPYHTPVMWKQCIDGILDCERGRIRKQVAVGDATNTVGSKLPPLVFVDGTLGGGGHSAALLSSLRPGDILFGCDVDPRALATASERLRDYMDHDGSDRPLFVPVRTNFGDMATVLPAVPHPVHGGRIVAEETFGVDGVLLDLGVSSHQIDEPDRGFSFMRDGPLDMRMSASVGGHTIATTMALPLGPTNSGLTAADICNEFDERELQRIFSVYGDEPRARVIAKAVVQHRPLSTTGDLAQAIASVVPAFAKSKRKGLTATCARIFQSLRIVVNNEDGVLERVLSEVCPSLLRPGGRLVVMSYHSMEDRATKRIMRDGSLDPNRRRFTDDRDLYGNHMGPAKPFKPVGKLQKASEDETSRNPRARSAVLRIAERQDS